MLLLSRTRPAKLRSCGCENYSRYSLYRNIHFTSYLQQNNKSHRKKKHLTKVNTLVMNTLIFKKLYNFFIMSVCKNIYTPAHLCFTVITFHIKPINQSEKPWFQWSFVQMSLFDCCVQLQISHLHIFFTPLCVCVHVCVCTFNRFNCYKRLNSANGELRADVAPNKDKVTVTARGDRTHTHTRPFQGHNSVTAAPENQRNDQTRVTTKTTNCVWKVMVQSAFHTYQTSPNASSNKGQDAFEFVGRGYDGTLNLHSRHRSRVLQGFTSTFLW